jgi:GH24 family phage-related lysozyme (muramidase)
LKPTKISREGVILIKSFEGFRPRAIQRDDGRWMIGYGHTASAREGLTVSEVDAELLLQYDLLPVVKAIDEVQAPLNQHQYDALASFVFSIGVDRFRSSEVLRRLNAGETQAAAEALAAWIDDGGPLSPPRRRATERALFVANPDAPVSLADLLSAPLPPATATILETTEAAGSTGFDAVDVAPFPAHDASEPMTWESAISALLNESDLKQADEEVDEGPDQASHPADDAADAPASQDAETPMANGEAQPVEAEPVTTVEPLVDAGKPCADSASPPAESSVALLLDEPAVEAEPEEAKAVPRPAESSDGEAETSEPPVEADAGEFVAPALEQPTASDEPEPASSEPASASPAARPAPSAAAFYSPYVVRVTGPLALFSSAAPSPLQPAASASAVTAPLTPAPLETLAAEAEPANDDGVSVPEEAAAAQAVEAEAASVDQPAFEPSNAPSPTPTPTFADAPDVEEQTVQVPMFLIAPTEPSAPLDSEQTSAGRLEAAPPPDAATDATEITDLDQTALFDTEVQPEDGLHLSVDREATPDKRFDWGETATFLVMGGIGMLAFGAAMAAFRQASNSTGGETAVIGWVLAIIALACVGVSGYNLFQRWGRPTDPTA